MYYYKMIIQYNGANYMGLQWQKDLPTIQSELNQAIKILINDKISTVAASRTDTGVHALKQYVRLSCAKIIDHPSSFVTSLNRTLPNDIRCIHIESCDATYKPTLHSSSKEYRYLFTNQKITINKEQAKYIANISNNLNINKIKRCAKMCEGLHDFRNFASTGSNVKSTSREIYTCELSEINPQDFFHQSELFIIPSNLNHCYQLKISGNGFLKQMIRHLVSALWMVGSGKLSEEDFLLLLDGPTKSKALWKVAPPGGLYLYNIIHKS